MRTRIVRITRKKSGQAVSRESLVDTPSVRIGRGNDNDVQLSGLTIRLHHAVIEPSPDGPRLIGAEGAEVWVDGALAAEAPLQEGSVVRIGPHELRRLPPRANEDLCVSVEAMEAPSEVARTTRPTLHLSKRRLSWLLSATMVVLFLVLPLGLERMQSWYSSGPLTRSHAHLGDACSRCHTVPFQQVQDVACGDCHPETSPHVSPPRRDAQPSRCGVCHPEHRGMPSLSWVDQGFCADCHPDARDFGNQHPELRPWVVRDPREAPVRVTWSPTVQESSGLRFNHLRHVGQLVVDPTTLRSGVMRCDRCHEREADGSLMRPVRFERHCQSCHKLSFDDEDAQRETVHETPANVRADLVEYYSTARSSRAARSPTGIDTVRARPGENDPKRSHPSRNDSSELNPQVERAMAFLFDDSSHKATCLVCHVRELDTASAVTLSPVRTIAARLPANRFRHESHMSVGCLSCHPSVAVFDPEFAPDTSAPTWAQTGVYELLDPAELLQRTGLRPSTSAADVNLPGIASCRTCHSGGGGAENRVASDCFLCHDYHRRPVPVDGRATTDDAPPAELDDMLRY